VSGVGLAVNSKGKLVAAQNSDNSPIPRWSNGVAPVGVALALVDAESGLSWDRAWSTGVEWPIANPNSVRALVFDENDDDLLYGYQYYVGFFSYRLDTKEITRIGGNAPDMTGMDIDPTDGRLYGSSDSPLSLWTIDRATGDAAKIADMSNKATDIAFDADGNLYGVFRDWIGSINKATGAVTRIGSVSGFSGVAGLDCFYDAAPPAEIVACAGFESPMNKSPVRVKKNRALPLKAELFGSDTFARTDADLVAPPVVQVVLDGAGEGEGDYAEDVLPAGQGSEGNQFVFTDEGVWQFNLKTSRFTAPGTYTITMESGDPEAYTLDSQCEAKFVIQ
jgi:hypothetical protein